MTTFLAWVGGAVGAVVILAAAGFAGLYFLTSGFTKWE